MDSSGGLLSLKWNNHTTTFTSVLSHLREKNSYSDVTIACDGKMFAVHKLVLSTCSEYFEQIFEQTSCKHPVIVLKDIKATELDALLNYMYIGEVNVLQTELSGLIKAAECLKIKGLAVPDDQPTNKSQQQNRVDQSDGVISGKRQTSKHSVNSPPTKRLRRSDDERTLSETSEYTRKSKQSSPLDRNRLDNSSDKRNNSDSRNNQHKLMSQTSSQEVVLLDDPGSTVKSEAASPKHEVDYYHDEDDAVFGDDTREGAELLDDIIATVDTASDSGAQPGGLLPSEGDGRFGDGDQYEAGEGEAAQQSMARYHSASGHHRPHEHVQEQPQAPRQRHTQSKSLREDSQHSVVQAGNPHEASERDISDYSDQPSLSWLEQSINTQEESSYLASLNNLLSTTNLPNNTNVYPSSYHKNISSHNFFSGVTTQSSAVFSPNSGGRGNSSSFGQFDDSGTSSNLHESDNCDHMCVVCSKTFNQKSLLKRHMKIHATDEKCKCHFCNFETTFKFNLKSHMARRHQHICDDSCDLSGQASGRPRNQ